MERNEFERLVARAVERLPHEFRASLENIDIVIKDWPDRYQSTRVGLGRDRTLLGLYEGVPQTRRTHYGMVPPDKITIFQRPIEAACRHNGKEITDEIASVVRHEIAHHFGISEARLKQIEQESEG